MMPLGTINAAASALCRCFADVAPSLTLTLGMAAESALCRCLVESASRAGAPGWTPKV